MRPVRYGKIASAVAVLGTLIFFFSLWIAPSLIESGLRNRIQARCSSCEFSTGESSFSFFPLRLKLKDLRFEAGEKGATSIKLRCERLEATLSWSKLIQGSFHFEPVEWVRPEVVLLESSDGSPASSPSGRPSELPNLVIKKLVVKEGSFTYLWKGDGKTAPLKVTELRVDVPILTINDEERDQVSAAFAAGRLEQTGLFDLVIQAKPLSHVRHADLELKLRELNLGDLNPYFTGSDGLSLKGRLHEGNAQVRLRGNQLKASVRAVYGGLALDVRQTDSRSPLSAFFMDWFASLKLDPKNTDEKRELQERTVEIQTEPDESVVSFMLRGMKDAALQVASK